MVFVNTSTDLSLIKWKRIVAISEEGTKFQINLRTYLMQATKSGLCIWAMGFRPSTHSVRQALCCNFAGPYFFLSTTLFFP